jgi:isopenicillin N synthase-like dioxygenase
MRRNYAVLIRRQTDNAELMMATTTLPMLDLSQYQGENHAAFLQQLRQASRDVGFFYLTGHGISLETQQQILALGREFFALPLADKAAVQMLNSPHFRGYTGLNGELTRGQPDQREQFDIMREDPVVGLPTSNALWRRLVGPNQWPAALPVLKPALLAFQQQLTDVTIQLLHAMLEALELPADALDHTITGLNGHEGPYQHMKLIRYPVAAANASKQGVGAHKDPGYLTLVLQDQQAGLEVETADGWILAQPVAGAFVVNIGELLEMASNGYLKATTHRVTSPQTQDRYSAAFFMAAQLDATVPVLPLKPELAAEAQGPATDPANPLLRQVGDNTLKGRLRSHRDVAARHYPELAQAS